jgi:Spy/CpxP family protein refolding chaperone
MHRAVSLTLLAVVFAVPAWAEGPELKDPFEGMYNPKRLLRGAQLTEQQVEQIRTQRLPGRAAERAIENQMDECWNDFNDRLLGDGPVDTYALTVLAEKCDRLSAQLNQLKIRTMFKMRDLLTKDQLAAVRRARADMKDLDQRTKDLEARKRAIPATIAAENSP